MTNCEEPSLFRKLEIDKLEHDYNIQTSKNKSNTDCTLNVDTWDNTMKVKSDETDNNTYDQITLDKNLQTTKIEGNKTKVNNLIYNRIDDKIDIINKQREHMSFKVIDENIKENDQSHQNVDNTTGQGVNISLF